MSQDNKMIEVLAPWYRPELVFEKLPAKAVQTGYLVGLGAGLGALTWLERTRGGNSLESLDPWGPTVVGIVAGAAIGFGRYLIEKRLLRRKIQLKHSAVWSRPGHISALSHPSPCFACDTPWWR